jgi:DNA-directed RNA polymerase specialized sigma24 family protein/CheY-like chemotaxis protein
MPSQARIAGHLPYLRRYARALTGSQASGDAYVIATIDALAAGNSVFEGTVDPRIGLFRLFTHIWNSVPVNGVSTPADRSGSDDQSLAAEQRIAHITPRARQAFLLVALESFSEEQAAQILAVDVRTLRSLLDESGRELAAEIATDVLIIEDEILIAMELEEVVKNLGHDVVGIARTRKEALAIVEKERPGLILADIQLADGSSGLDAVNDMLGSFQVPVIFITAYPERFLTGTRPEPAFLVAKPFEPAMVSAIVSQALFFRRNARLPQQAPAASALPNLKA